MNGKGDSEKPFSELCVISEEEGTYKGAIKWHIPKPEIQQYFIKISSDCSKNGKYAELESNWFSIGSPSYCSFYIRVHPCSYDATAWAGKLYYGYLTEVCVSIIFNRKLPDCAWVKGEIYFDGLGQYKKHETFSVSAKDFDKKIEFTNNNFATGSSKVFFTKYDSSVTIYCSMKISMREVKCAFDKEIICYGESRDYDSSKQTVKHDSFSDVKISINDHLFKTHKTVLAQIPYFQELFDADDSKQYFELSDIEPEIFNHILTFLYSRDIPHLHFRLASELYIVASDLKFSDLECLCSSYLGANLTETNVFMVLKLSDTFKDVALKKECVKFIKGGDIETLSEKGIIL